ncbi:MAG: hypothetical protein Q9195_004830 [Heterodermia aff. obscurata]
MRPSLQLLAPGFMKRSLDEIKRFSIMGISALTFESLKTTAKPYHLLDFSDPEMIQACKTMSDADLGGFSTVSLKHVPKNRSEPAHAHFHGNISIELPKGRPEIQRTGYAAWRNHDRPATIFGKPLWNMDPYAFLALRVKSDGRKYFVNVQTESIVYTDIHQHRLYAQRPGQWETVLIKWGEFVRTNYGQVVEPQTEMLIQKVRTVGIGLTDRVPGPFDLAISAVWATNGQSEGIGKHGRNDDFHPMNTLGN